MFEFAWVWIWLCLPLPLLVRACVSPVSGEAPLWVPFMQDFAVLEQQMQPGRGMRTLALLPAACAWLLLVAAAARPQWLGEVETLPASGRDLMMAVDLSLSMRERDMQLPQAGVVNRLEMVKYIAGEFIRRREGDRVGLVLFGARPYLQAPLTFDTETVSELLYESEIGLLGKKTSIGDAIGLSIKRLRLDEGDEHVLILLTDGANTAGEVAPLEAADYAAAEGVRIYTIGIGGGRGRSLFGLLKSRGDLDEASLQQIAERTGGRYFRARDSGELQRLFRELDQLEPLLNEQEGFRPRTELYFWPLAGAFVLASLLALWSVYTGHRGSRGTEIPARESG